MTPSGWAETPLGSIFKLTSGKLLGKKDQFPLGEDHQVPVYSSAGVTGFTVTPLVTEPVLIIGRVGASGSVFRTSGDAWVTDNALYTERFHGDYVLSFLEYLLKHERLEQYASKTAQPLITQRTVHDLVVKIPPLPEQKKIAAILGSVDDAIQATQAVIDQTRKVKKGLLQQLLTRGIGHTQFKQTEIGEVPEGWSVRRLDEVVSPSRPITYGIVQTGPTVEGGVPCVRVVDLTRGRIDVSRLITTTQEISQSYRRTILREGDIMFALRGEIGHVVSVNAELVGANLTRGVAIISPGVDVLTDYLLWAIRSPSVRDRILLGVNGSALKEIPIGELRKVTLPVPPVNEQLDIAAKLNAVEVTTRENEDLIDTLLSLKASLVADLLSGRTRVEVSA